MEVMKECLEEEGRRKDEVKGWFYYA